MDEEPRDRSLQAEQSVGIMLRADEFGDKESERGNQG